MPNMSLTKVPMPEQDPNVRNKNFLEVAMGYTEEMAMEEASRCLNCKNKPCVSGCPVNVRIPEFVAKVAEGKFEEAYEIITAPEDFSAVREVLEKENYPMASAEVTMIPQNYVTLTDENDIRQLNRTLDLLDEDDDVQDVFHNWDE